MMQAILSYLKLRLISHGVISLALGAGVASAYAQPSEVELPRQMAWTAFNIGTTGYNQSVGIGAMLRDKYGVTLRVIPGQNDISRMIPLKTGRVDFTANGVATYLAQEGVFQFADSQWGPQPLRILISSNGLSNHSLAVAAESGISNLSELRGRRVPYVRGAPGLNLNMEAYLACGGLTWDDVTRVDFPGYEAKWNGLINGDVDVAFGNTVSGPSYRLEASPRGILWLKAPHDNEDCWQRISTLAPYLFKHIATRGASISDAAVNEAGSFPYPILTTTASQDRTLSYSLTRAISENYDDFKDSDPGAIGWALESQIFEWVVPYHEGAVDYWREIGVWTESLDAHNEALIRRQEVLAQAWAEMTSRGIRNDDEFADIWLQLRRQHLEAAGMDPVWK